MEKLTHAEASRKFNSKTECVRVLTGVKDGIALAPSDSLKMSYLAKVIREEVPHIM